MCVCIFSSVIFKQKQVSVSFVRACNKFRRHGLFQSEVVGCIVWWLGLYPAQVITIQSIAFPEEVTDRQRLQQQQQQKTSAVRHYYAVYLSKLQIIFPCTSLET